MYICICKQVTDREIEAAIAGGHNTFKKLCKELKVGQNCGKCCVHAKQILENALENQPAAPLSPIAPHTVSVSSIQVINRNQ